MRHVHVRLNSARACGTRVRWIIEEDGPARGLHLNWAKSLLHIPECTSPISNSLRADMPITQGGFDLLGSPICPSAHCETVFSRVRKVEEILARLPDLQDAQMEFLLLCSCLALPKVAFALRSCPPSKIRGATAAFDRAMREAVSDLKLLGPLCLIGSG